MDPRAFNGGAGGDHDRSADPRANLALWLRAGRAQRKLSLDDVARVTKIQPRILEKLEAGQLEGLPAEVFVRGFIRSFARCVGLDESVALEKLGACAGSAPSAIAAAFVETMVPKQLAALPQPQLDPEPEILVEVAAPVVIAEKKKRTRKKSTSTDGAVAAPRSRKKKIAPAIEVFAEGSAEMPALEATQDIAVSSAPLPIEDLAVPSLADGSVPIEVWQPTMPPLVTTPSVPWRRPAFTATTMTSTAQPIVVLSIDDADPDLADRERDDRDVAKRVSFLPPILLDREDRSGRQGGLTLAVIILLIAATLTLSYLMRRPSANGDGVTMLDGRATTTTLLA